MGRVCLLECKVRAAELCVAGLGKRCRQGWLKQVGCCWRVESSRAERVVKSITSIAGFLCLASAQQLSTGMEKSIELPSRPGSHGASA